MIINQTPKNLSKPVSLSQQEKIVYLFTLLCYFVIGFIVRNDGAIHRYKSAITLVAMLHIANRFYFSKKEPVKL